MNDAPNLLEFLGLELPCPLCGHFYRLPLKSVAISKRMLHEGCPVSDERECPPILYGPLVAPSLLHDLQASWARLAVRAQELGGRVVTLSPQAKP